MAKTALIMWFEQKLSQLHQKDIFGAMLTCVLARDRSVGKDLREEIVAVIDILIRHNQDSELRCKMIALTLMGMINVNPLPNAISVCDCFLV